ncbi:MAG TPA: hypothetical protein VLW45_05970 [Pelomicrobium sp.]|nr:hypothetical protein [Pelomicrobium sp.]
MARSPAAKRNLTRERIAHLAARLIAEDGVQDFGLAKRKAAQQIGAPDTRNLPNNAEVEEALRAFRALYQSEEHPELLRELRLAALDAMEWLVDFDPQLTGSVLSGTAGRYSDINLHLVAESVKDVEYFLMRENVAFRSGERRHPQGNGARLLPTFSLVHDSVPLTLTVYAPGDPRGPSRGPDGEVLRARTPHLRALLESEAAEGAD